MEINEFFPNRRTASRLNFDLPNLSLLVRLKSNQSITGHINSDSMQLLIVEDEVRMADLLRKC